MADFGVGAVEVAAITAAYFYGYMAMQVPAGVIVERWGPRRAVLTSLIITGVGTWWFARASTVAEAAVTRALVASGDALIFSSLIKLVTQWFPARRFGFMAGLSQASGYLGALLATAPLAVAVSTIGWRTSFTVLMIAIVANLLGSAVLLQDRGQSQAPQPSTLVEVLREMVLALRRVSTWGLLVSAIGAYVASLSLSGVWGTPLWMQAYGLSRTAAGSQMFLFMASYAVGALAIGYLSDARFRTLRRPIMTMGIARALLLVVVTPAVGTYLPLTVTALCFAGLGFMAGATVSLGIAAVRLNFASAGVAVGIGLTAAISNMASGIAQPLLGAILERHWGGAVIEGARQYEPAGYTWLLLSLAAVSALSVPGALLIVDKDRKQ